MYAQLEAGALPGLSSDGDLAQLALALEGLGARLRPAPLPCGRAAARAVREAGRWCDPAASLGHVRLLRLAAERGLPPQALLRVLRRACASRQLGAVRLLAGTEQFAAQLARGSFVVDL
jgi:hypothetical protein